MNFLHVLLSDAPPATDGGAAAAAGATAGFRAGGDQRGDSPRRRQHGRHGGPSRQEEEDHPDGPEKVNHNLVQIHGEEVQHHLLHLLISRHPEHSQDVDV